MSEVKALKDNINAQIKMAEIFAEEIEKTDGQNTTNGVKYSKYAPKNRFEKALSKTEWNRFYSAVINPTQSTGVRVGDNGILLYDENNIYNSKIICYDEIGEHLEVNSVYRLENYDQTIHENKLDAPKFITGLEKGEYDENTARTILADNSNLYGTIFKRYSTRIEKFVDIREQNNRNGKGIRNQSRRGNYNQENQRDKGEITDKKYSLDELSETLPGTKFSIFEDSSEYNLIEI